MGNCSFNTSPHEIYNVCRCLFNICRVRGRIQSACWPPGCSSLSISSSSSKSGIMRWRWTVMFSYWPSLAKLFLVPSVPNSTRPTSSLFSANTWNTDDVNQALSAVVKDGLVHPKNEHSVINYSPSCRTKPMRPSFIFRTQIKIFLIKSESSDPP